MISANITDSKSSVMSSSWANLIANVKEFVKCKQHRLMPTGYIRACLLGKRARKGPCLAYTVKNKWVIRLSRTKGNLCHSSLTIVCLSLRISFYNTCASADQYDVHIQHIQFLFPFGNKNYPVSCIPQFQINPLLS